MIFNQAIFIKTPQPFTREYRPYCSAPLFRKHFMIENKYKEAKLAVCALGYGEFYINGKLVTEDKFIAPVSDYNKTLWYTIYDVADLLQEGENVFAAVLGNGFYNETFKTSWNFNEAAWRDQPKLLAEIFVDEKSVLATGEDWRCKNDSFITYNHVRSGEHFDARLWQNGWNENDFDDSEWACARIDDTPPTGVLRECLSPPVREFEVYPSKSMMKSGENRWVFDIGQMISGYVRLNIHLPAGTKLKICYGEKLNEDGTFDVNETPCHYPESEYMTDYFISDGNEWHWSPRFTYHGFRYIEITGFPFEPVLDMVSGVFVHQAIKEISGFSCSDERVNKLFKLGQLSTWSNLMYMPTDCPSREKMGWANDAQSSCEQFLLNFDMEAFLRKWLQDIFDAMRNDGAMPGVIPTGGWGYDWCGGPVCDGVLFEVPYRLYEYSGDPTSMRDALPFFSRYLAYLDGKADKNGIMAFGLDDWASPTDYEHSNTPATIINAILRIKFLRIAALAEKLSGDFSNCFEKKLKSGIEAFKKDFMNGDGTCAVNSMTACAMVIVHGLFEILDPIKQQLMRIIEDNNFHHDCGMVGIPHLFKALDICGLSDWAWRILTADGYPGYMLWIEKGATTLWETWQGIYSLNHHMYSAFMAWLVQTPGGIHLHFPEKGKSEVTIQPEYIPDIEWVDAWRDTEAGRIGIKWHRKEHGIQVTLSLPKEIPAKMIMPNGVVKALEDGETTIFLEK